MSGVLSANFPQKLFNILRNESDDIVMWSTSGLGFRIVDAGKFSESIMPKYFRRKFMLFLINMNHIFVLDITTDITHNKFLNPYHSLMFWFLYVIYLKYMCH